MPLEVLLCCKIAVATGAILGVCDIVQQSYRSRRRCARQIAWDGAEAIRSFAVGCGAGTIISVPFLIPTQGIMLSLKAAGVVSLVLVPFHAVALFPGAAKHVMNHLPIYFGSEIAFTMSVTSLCRSLASLNPPLFTLQVVHSTALIVGMGTMSFMAFEFANRLAVTELHLLYGAILPRERNAPEVDSYRGLIRFTQFWGNMTAITFLISAVRGDHTLPIRLLIFNTSLSDVAICNVLFLGLFHHLQSVNATAEEKMLHRFSWICFIPLTFFSANSVLLPSLMAAAFISSYQPYWQAMETLEIQVSMPILPATPAHPATAATNSATIAAPAFPAEPALPLSV